MENIAIALKFSCITLQPRLELLRGPPTHCGSSLQNPRSFRLLPLAVSAGGGPLSPDGPSTCLWNAGGRVKKSHGLFLCIHTLTCESPLLWQCSADKKSEVCGSIVWHSEPGSRCSYNHPAEMIWDLLCLECEDDQKVSKECPFFKSWTCRTNFQYKVLLTVEARGAIHGWSGRAGYARMIPLW